MPTKRIAAPTLAGAMACAALNSALAGPAPLPKPFAADAIDERHLVRAQLMPAQRGIYAHGHAGPEPDIMFAGPVCVGSDDEQNALIDSIPGAGMVEFWFYATRAQGVLFSRTASLDSAKPCAVALRYRFEVERAFVADGFVHRLSVDEHGANSLASLALTYSAGKYSSGFYLLHNLMARPDTEPQERSQGRDRIAGVTARCHGDGGIVWSTVCVAASGPARGMLLRAAAGDDEQHLFWMEIDELRPQTVLPGELFELDRTWRGVTDHR